MIRLATDAEGPRIAELVAAGGFTIGGLDWSEVHPYWLIAVLRQAQDEEERIVGCIQIILGKPVGWLEMLSLEPDMGRKRKARAVKALVSHGAAYLKSFGSQVAMGSVAEDLEPFMAVLAHRGAVITARGFTVAKRL